MKIKPISAWKNIVKAYSLIFLGALIYTIGFQVFLQQAKVFPSGLSAFASLITFSDPSLIRYVSLIYLALNIPLILFFWKKNKKRFVYRTCFFLVIQAAIGSIFIIDEVELFFDKLITFGNKDTTFKHEWRIFTLAIIAAIFMGFGISLAWKNGGSSAGTDFIGYYFSTKKQLSIGTILFIIAMNITFFSFATSLIFNVEIRAVWMETLLASFMYSLIVSFVVNNTYPKYNKVEISLSSKKWKEIDKYLKTSRYWHAWSLSETTSGYSGEKKVVIKTIMFLLESKDFIRNISKIDDQAFIYIKKIHRVKGKISSHKID